MSRVLLTGGSGFLGAPAVDRLLAEGHEVHAVARRVCARGNREGVIWHYCDLLLDGAAEELAREVHAEGLLHLAWYAVPGLFWESAENELWVDASLRLLRAFGECGGRRAVIAGTCAEYGWGAEEPLHEERSAIEPDTLYGASKHATHLGARSLADELGVSLAWGRIFFPYGPREDPRRLVASVTRGLLSGEEVATTEGTQRRDFMHVADVAGALTALLDGELTGAVNVCSGEPTSVRDVVGAIAELTGGIERVRFGGLPSREDEPALVLGDARTLREDAGYSPSFTLSSGLADTVAWWRAQLERVERKH